MVEVAQSSAAGAGANGDQSGTTHYEQQRNRLKEMMHQKALLAEQLQQQEQSILQKETEYLEMTPHGNIIMGFDNYIKGGNAAAQRKRTGMMEQNRVFSRSSVSYNKLNNSGDNNDSASAVSTPGAPTPLSTSFAKSGGQDGGSNQPTPTSATEKKAPGKKKKAAGAAKRDAPDGEDSETDTREVKKVRTHFGAVRK
ncbi:NuA4-domain-containing protein [Xylariomycetidae sp. FL2044]|nr:NuA4-domain-containing protein [Xylariomycetidae sp. FL2044]